MGMMDTGEKADRPGWEGEKRGGVFLALLLFSSALYLPTLAPSVATIFDDSLEFQVVAYSLLVAHPTGYPLYTLLGWVFMHALPLGDAAYRLNLLSALCGALTVGLVGLLSMELCTPDEGRAARYAGGLVGGASLAVCGVFWSQATIAEVYTLNAALVAAVLLATLRLLRSPRLSRPALALAAFLFGLGLAHHRTITLLLPAILLALWLRRREMLGLLRESPRAYLYAVAALCAPLLLYLYLPMRGASGSLDGTYTNTWGGFWWWVTASGYTAFFGDNPLGGIRSPGFYFSLFYGGFGPVGLILGAVGAARLLPKSGRAAVTALAFAVFAAFGVLYRVSDVEVFFIPPLVIFSAWVGSGLAFAWRLGAERFGRGAVLALLAVVLVQTGFLLHREYPMQDRSDDRDVYNYGVDIMGQPLEQGASIVGIQGEITLVRYFQEAHGMRPDLRPIAADDESKRLEVVERELRAGRAVYLTRTLPGAADRWHLGAAGPLIRVDDAPLEAAPPTMRAAGVDVTDRMRLLGYDLSHPDSGHGEKDDTWRLTLYWQPTARIEDDLKVSARLIGPAGELLAQTDAVPVHFAYPTDRWRTGEVVIDVYDLALPTGAFSGEGSALVIVYDPARGAAEVGRAELPLSGASR